MTLRDKLPGRTLKEAGYWSAIGIAGGYCVVTMVFVPLLALVAGSYLAFTQQYAIAIGLTVLGFGGGYWIHRRRMNNETCTAETVS